MSSTTPRGGLFLHRRLLGRAVIVTTVLAAALFGALLLSTGQDSTATAVGPSALDQALIGELGVPEGKTLHLRTEVYVRYGPKAAEIRTRNRDVPETTVSESWWQMGPRQTIIRYFARQTDASSGDVLQETSFEPELAFTKDSRTGAVLSSVVPSGPAQLTAPRERAERLQRDLANGFALILEESASKVVVQYREIVTPEDDSTGYSLPYILDLEPVEVITTLTLSGEGIVLESTLHVLTKSGQKILVASRLTTVVEVLDEFPSGLK